MKFIGVWKKISKLKKKTFWTLRRIQQKYFDLIRRKLLERIDFIKSRASKETLKNTITRTFFFFSYKRYRFHFGIYIPCDHFYAPGSSIIATQCHGPSPFVMSSYRHACGAHQSEFFRNQINHYLKPKDREKSPFINSKSTHANHLYQLWQHRYCQKIFSNRLGIEYNIRFTANGTNFVRKHPNAYMYRKHLSNFKRIPSNNHKTKRKQEARFKRYCTRVFKSTTSKPITTKEALSLPLSTHLLTYSSFEIQTPLVQNITWS